MAVAATRGFDAVNHAIYVEPRMVGAFPFLGRWETKGEERSLARAAGEVRGGPVLDIGVGRGRTTSLLRLLTDDYIGIDYSAAMVDAARAAHPGVDIRVGDARDLSGLGRSDFALVLFSFNGIDAMGHDERTEALRQVAGVLRPGGWFAYSTLNRLGAYYLQPPWRPDPRPPGARAGVAHMAGVAARVVRDREMHLRWWRSWLALRGEVDDHDTWATAPLGGGGAGMVMHWSTVAGVRTEVVGAGLEVEAVFDNDGTALEGDAEASTPWIDVLARKPR